MLQTVYFKEEKNYSLLLSPAANSYLLLRTLY